MARFVPFVGSFIKPEFVRRVPAPAFDSMNGQQREAYLDTHPESYTLVTRSPGDGGPEDDAHPDRLIELGREALDRIFALDAFTNLDDPAFFLYRLQFDGHRQLGVVGLVETADYAAGTVKRHEQVSAERALHLSKHFEQLGVQSSPIALGYRSDPAIRTILDGILGRLEPSVSFTSGDGLEQAVWVVDDVDDCAALTHALVDHELYIMDGHHRAAASATLSERVGSPRGDYMLGVLFADDRVNIDPFHRRVRVDDDADVDTIIASLRERLGLRPCPAMATELPSDAGAIGVCVRGEWFCGDLPAAMSDSALDAIDPVRLQRQVIGPVLGVDPERGVGQISYFLDDIDRRALGASLHDRELLFVLRAVTPAEVFAVADDGDDMPPKSTYVIPKPRSGVFLRRF